MVSPDLMADSSSESNESKLLPLVLLLVEVLLVAVAEVLAKVE